MPSRPVYTAEVSGVPVYFDEGTFSIQESLNGQARLNGTIRSEDGTYRPAADADVIATENGIRIFGGLLVEPHESGLGSIGGVKIQTAIDAVDYTVLLALANVDDTFPDQSLKAMLQQLVTHVGGGVTLDPAQATGPTVKGFLGDNRTALDLLGVLAAETQWIFELNYNKVLRMYAPGTNPAPFSITNAAEYQLYVEGDVEVWRPGGAAKPNRVIVVAGGTPKLVDVVDTFQADGVTNSFVLDHQIAGWIPGSSVGAVGYGIVYVSHPLMYSGSNTESIGHPSITTLDWTYDHATRTITRRLGAPPNGTTFSVPYQAQMPFTVVAEDAADIALRGVRAVTVKADTTYDRQVAQQMADDLLATYQATPAPVRAQFRTKGLGLRVGMHINIELPIRGLTGVFTVTEINTTVADGYDVQRIVTVVQGLVFRGSPTTSLGVPPAGTSGLSGFGGPAPPNRSVQYNNNGVFGGAENVLYGDTLFYDLTPVSGQPKNGGLFFVQSGSLYGLSDPQRMEMGLLSSGDFSMDLFGTGAGFLLNTQGDINLTAGAPSGNGMVFLTSNNSGIRIQPAFSTSGAANYTRLERLTVLDGLAGAYHTVSSLPFTINTSGVSDTSEFLGFISTAGTGTMFLPAISAGNFRIFPNSAVGRIFHVINAHASGTLTLDANTVGGTTINNDNSIALGPRSGVWFIRHDNGYKIIASHGAITGGGAVSGGSGAAAGPINAVQFNNPLGFFDGDAQFTWDTAKGQLELTHVGSHSLLKLVNPFGGYGPIALDIGANNNIFFGAELSGGSYLARTPSPGYFWHQGQAPSGNNFVGMGFEQETDEVPGSPLAFAKGMGFDLITNALSGYVAGGDGGYAEIYSYGYGSNGRGSGLHIYRNTASPSGAPGYLGLQDRSGVGGSLSLAGKFWYLWPDISGNPRWGSDPPRADGSPADTDGLLLGNTATVAKRSFGLTIDGGGSTITTGVKGFVRMPCNGTISKVTLLSTDAGSPTSGSIVVDIWKDTYANYPPTVADSITASAKPTISSATKSEDSTLTGWTTSFVAGDIFGFNVDSVTSLKRVTLVVDFTPS